jgi:APA family basic amino acid/polyamine antiporter
MKFAETLLILIFDGDAPPGLVPILGLAAIWILTVVNYFGVKPGTVVQNIFTSGKLIALATLIVIGLALPRETHLSLRPFLEGGYDGNLFVAMGAALAPVLFAYGGWQNSTYTAGEVKDPQRTLPRALMLGILIVIAVYVSIAVVYLHVLPVETVRASGTLATDTARQLMGRGGAQFVSAAIVVSTFGFIDMTILTAPRVFFAMARDGCLVSAAGYLHPKYQSPVVVLVLFATLTSFYLLAGSYGALLGYATFGDWIFFGLAVLTVFTLRRKHPDWPRPYRVWGYPITPALFVLVAFTFVVINFCVNQPQSTYGLGLIVLGIPAFYFFRRLNRP